MTHTIDALVEIEEKSDLYEVMEKWVTEHQAEFRKLEGMHGYKKLEALFTRAYEAYRKQNTVETVLPHYKGFSEFFTINYLGKLKPDYTGGKKR